MKGRKPLLKQDQNAVERVPAAPSWMSAHAKKEWKRIMPALVERRILTEADLSGVENYCVSVGRVRQVEVEMARADQVDPALFRMQDKAIQSARQLAAEYGLTPFSRSRTPMRDDGDDDDLLG